MIWGFSYIELVGTFFGFICVLLAVKESIWSWPTGIISVLLYTVFFYQQTLYASMVLQFVFLGYCIQGWYLWLYGGENKSVLTVSRIKKKQALWLTGFTIIVFVVLSWLFDTYTDNENPYLDSFVTSISLTAQWMMNNKFVENWLVWLLADVTYSVMFFNSGHYPSLFLYVSYVVSATFGYFLWMKSYRKTKTA